MTKIVWTFQKISILTPRKAIEIPKGKGESKAKMLKEMYKLKVVLEG